MNRTQLISAVIVAFLIVPEDVSAIGRPGGGGGRGGGGAARAGGGGGARMGGGGSRPAARPHTSAPNLGGGRGNVSRPNVGHANAGRPNINRPQGRPNVNRPGGAGGLAGGNSQRPGGGLKPSTRPATRPGGMGGGSRPNLGQRPTTLPGQGGSGIGSRPNTSLPNLGSRPGGMRPGGGYQRPGGGGADLANRPGVGDRPNVGNRPGAGGRPNLDNRPGLDRPGFAGRPGAGGRPSPGDLGDFLGMDKPLRPGAGDGIASTLPGRPGDRPGIGNRPGAGGGGVQRPGIDDRPGIVNRPGAGGGGVQRPGIDDGDSINNRPNFDDRDRWDHNNVINNRPQWANIDNSTNIDIHNRWNNAFTNVNNRGWWDRPAGRVGYWNGWADGVRNNWGDYGYRNNWFNGGWWDNHYCPIGGWHYHQWNHSYPSNYWWTVPAWGSLTSWFSWSAPQTVWSQPVYYDYGAGGNVTHENNNVYVGGEQVATADEFAQSAMTLATVPPPESEAQAAETEWMPLGTFAVSTNEKDTQPSQVVQLTVNKDGIVSGTMYNVDTDQAQAVQGQVDRETQRVAFRIGESETLVAETGLYNLTQEEAPVLVHFGPDHVENYLLVRLEEPDQQSTGSAAN